MSSEVPTRPERPEAQRWEHVERTVELAVVVLLLAPSALSFVPEAVAGHAGFGVTAAAIVLRDTGLTGLCALLVWRGRAPQWNQAPRRPWYEALSALGWRWRGAAREIAIGAAAFPLGLFLVRWLDATLQALGVPGPSAPATFLHPSRTPSALILATVVTGVVAVAEETIFRGYLMLRLGQVSGSLAVAVLGSSILFAMGHGYEGLSGAISVGALGAVYALLYRWRRSLVAPITAHFLQDFTLLVVFTMLSG